MCGIYMKIDAKHLVTKDIQIAFTVIFISVPASFLDAAIFTLG